MRYVNAAPPPQHTARPEGVFVTTARPELQGQRFLPASLAEAAMFKKLEANAAASDKEAIDGRGI
jgi:hypothetical protein